MGIRYRKTVIELCTDIATAYMFMYDVTLTENVDFEYTKRGIGTWIK